MSERSRTITWEDPLVTAAAAEGKTGLEFLRAIADGSLAPPPIGLLMGFRPIEAEEGRVVFAVEPDEYHYNPIGTVHGGLALTLLDSAMSCAVQTTLPVGMAYTTLEVKVNFDRPIQAGSGRVLAEGKIVNAGRTIATAEGRVYAEDSGKLLAHGTTTCLIFSVNGK